MLGVWYGVSYLLLDPERRFLVPPPHEVVRVGFLDYNLEELLDALWLSTRVAFGAWSWPWPSAPPWPWP